MSSKRKPKAMKASAVCFAAMALAVPVAGTTAFAVEIHNGFVTGNRYRELSEPEKSAYAAGLIDGMMAAPAFGARASGGVERLWKCTEQMTNVQLAAIFSKWIADHPEGWHRGMNAIAGDALIKACKLND